MIVVGYSADRHGAAALDPGIAEAKLRDTNLLVINATTGEALSDPRFAQSDEVHDVEEHLGGLREAGVGQCFARGCVDHQQVRVA